MALVVANVLITTLSEDLRTVADKQEAIAGLPMLLILLGLVGAAGEYRHRTAAPAALAAGGRRGRLLLARAGAYALTGLVLGALTAAVALGLGLPLLNGEPGPGLGSGKIAAVAAGSVVGAGLCAIIGVAAGALVRNQVVGVVGALILMLVGMPLLNIADHTAAEARPFGAAAVLAGDPAIGGTLSSGRSRTGARRLDNAAPARGDRRRTPPRPGMSDPTRAARRRAPAARPALVGVRRRARAIRNRRRARSRWPTRGRSVPAIVLAVVAGVALVLRRSAPLAVLATTLAAGVVVVALGDEVAGVAGGIALYTTAAICERRVSLAALVPTAAIAAGLSAATADAEGRHGVGRVRRDRRRHAGRRHLGARRLRADAASLHARAPRNARPTPNASASSWPGSRSTRSGRRSPASCTTSSRTRSA